MMAINAHQLAGGKRLKSHDELYMLIIPVSAVTIRLVSPTARMLAEHLVLERALALLESFGL
jgi:hypothetical protein